MTGCTAGGTTPRPRPRPRPGREGEEEEEEEEEEDCIIIIDAIFVSSVAPRVLTRTNGPPNLFFFEGIFSYLFKKNGIIRIYSLSYPPLLRRSDHALTVWEGGGQRRGRFRVRPPLYAFYGSDERFGRRRD